MNDRRRGVARGGDPGRFGCEAVSAGASGSGDAPAGSPQATRIARTRPRPEGRPAELPSIPGRAGHRTELAEALIDTLRRCLREIGVQVATAHRIWFQRSSRYPPRSASPCRNDHGGRCDRQIRRSVKLRASGGEFVATGSATVRIRAHGILPSRACARRARRHAALRGRITIAVGSRYTLR